MSDRKVHNAIIIGPSSSGKTSLVRYLADKYNGRCISLDGNTASGRPINSIMSFSNPKKFANEDIGVLIRKLMIKEVKQSEKNNIPWFIDDIDEYIIKLLSAKIRSATKIICIIPTFDQLIKNVIARNKEAQYASEERQVIGALRQLKNFVNVHFVITDNDKKNYSHMIISNKDIIKACEYDKIYYSLSEKQEWEIKTNEILERYGFKPMKSKKIIHAVLRPINLGQDLTVINNIKFATLSNKIDKYLAF